MTDDAAATIRAMEIVERTDVDKQDALVSLTPVAADKVRELMAEDPDGQTSVLRVAIQGGGCSGFQYGLGFDAGPVDDDETLEQHGVTIVIDPYSAPYLKGATIDFLSGLEESGFKIDNPNAQASCGCGHSFTVEEGPKRHPRRTAAAAAPAARTDLERRTSIRQGGRSSRKTPEGAAAGGRLAAPKTLDQVVGVGGARSRELDRRRIRDPVRVHVEVDLRKRDDLVADDDSDVMPALVASSIASHLASQARERCRPLGSERDDDELALRRRLRPGRLRPPRSPARSARGSARREAGAVRERRGTLPAVARSAARRLCRADRSRFPGGRSRSARHRPRRRSPGDEAAGAVRGGGGC